MKTINELSDQIARGMSMSDEFIVLKKFESLLENRILQIKELQKRFHRLYLIRGGGFSMQAMKL